MFCPYCGTKGPEDAAFCHKCGKSYANVQSSSPQSTLQQSAQQQYTAPSRQSAPQQYAPAPQQSAHQHNTASPPLPQPKKKRKWPWVLVGIFVLLFLLLLFSEDEPVDYQSATTGNSENVVTGDTDNDPPDILPAYYDPNDTWAIYWYICGSDLETKGGFASNDLAEMTQVKLPDNVCVVIEAGGAKRWHNGIEADGNNRYLYDSNGLTLLEKKPLANMGDSKSLEDFLRFCNTKYPADHQVLILWNHGGGSVAGVMFDELFNDDSLTLPEMRTAFEAVSNPSESNPPYEIIGFDACLMATIDVAEICHGFGKYLIASQEWEPALGWNYNGFLQALADNPGMSGEALGKVICDTYYDACKKENAADDITLSVIDLTRLSPLLDAYHHIGAESLIYACVNTNFFSDFGRAAKKAQNYGGNNFWHGYTNMVDLGDLVRQSGETLLPEFGNQLLGALEDCLVYQVKGPLRSRASGLACYYNYNGDYRNFNEFASIREDSPFRWYFDYALTGELSTEGQRYVQELANTYASARGVTPKKVASLQDRDLEDFPLVYTDDGYVYMDLGAEIADQLVGVYCYLAYYDVYAEQTIILGRDNNLDADWESGIFTDNFMGIWGSIDGVLCYMELMDETEDYQIYTVPVLLNNEEYSLRVSYVYDTEEYQILGARMGIDENGVTDRNLLQLKPGDVVEPLHYIMFDTDHEEDDFTVMALERLTVTADTRFEDIELEDGLYIFMFEMIDIQSNSYLSDIAIFSVEGEHIYLLEENE